VKLEKGKSGMYTTYDRFPVPISWVHNVFQLDTCQVMLRKYGSNAVAMGPLTFGTREEARKKVYVQRLWKQNDGMAIGPHVFAPVIIDDGMSGE
jgi:hypothetical protein